ELVVAHVERILGTHEREASPQLDQEVAEMLQQAALQITLVRLRPERQEVEVIGILENLLRQLGIRRWESCGKVGQRLSLASVEMAFDLMNQDATAPAPLQGFTEVPLPFSRLGDAIQDAHVVPPREFV